MVKWSFYGQNHPVDRPFSSSVPFLIAALMLLSRSPLLAQDVGLELHTDEESRQRVTRLSGPLVSSDPILRRQAAYRLGQLGPLAAPAVPGLREALKHETASVRRYAAEALGRIGKAARPSVPDLIDRKRELREDQPFQAIAIRAISRIDGNSAMVQEELLRAMNSSIVRVQVEAARGLLSGPHGPKAVDQLMGIARRENEPAAFEAVMAIGQLSTDLRSRCTSDLVDLLSSPTPDVARASVDVLTSCVPIPLNDILEKMNSSPPAVAHGLHCLGHHVARRRVVVLYASPAEADRFDSVMQELTRVVFPAAFQRLADPESANREAAIAALSEGGPFSVHWLLGRIEDEALPKEQVASISLCLRWAERRFPSDWSAAPRADRLRRGDVLSVLNAAIRSTKQVEGIGLFRLFDALGYDHDDVENVDLNWLRAGADDADARIRYHARRSLQRLEVSE